MDGLGKLHQFGAAQSSDGATGIEPEPLDGASERILATADLSDQDVHHVTQRSVGVQVLARRQQVENRFRVRRYRASQRPFHA